MQIELGE